MAKELDPKYLEGLVFKSASKKKVKDETTGAIKEKSISFERTLTANDVMSFREEEHHVIICTTDGRKHTVAKKRGKALVVKSSLDGSVGDAIDVISKMADAATIKAFVKGDERKGVVDASEAALAGLK